MTDKPPEDEPGAEDRFKRGIANALRTPPKPHAKKAVGKAPNKATKKATDGG